MALLIGLRLIPLGLLVALILRQLTGTPVVVVPPSNRRFTAFRLHLPQQAPGLLL
jgi:hypothetical protein